jgi:hypothetical protein
MPGVVFPVRGRDQAHGVPVTIGLPMLDPTDRLRMLGTHQASQFVNIQAGLVVKRT